MKGPSVDHCHSCINGSMVHESCTMCVLHLLQFRSLLLARILSGNIWSLAASLQSMAAGLTGHIQKTLSAEHLSMQKEPVAVCACQMLNLLSHRSFGFFLFFAQDPTKRDIDFWGWASKRWMIMAVPVGLFCVGCVQHHYICSVTQQLSYTLTHSFHLSLCSSSASLLFSPCIFTCLASLLDGYSFTKPPFEKALCSKFDKRKRKYKRAQRQRMVWQTFSDENNEMKIKGWGGLAGANFE